MDLESLSNEAKENGQASKSPINVINYTEFVDTRDNSEDIEVMEVVVASAEKTAKRGAADIHDNHTPNKKMRKRGSFQKHDAPEEADVNKRTTRNSAANNEEVKSTPNSLSNTASKSATTTPTKADRAAEGLISRILAKKAERKSLPTRELSHEKSDSYSERGSARKSLRLLADGTPSDTNGRKSTRQAGDDAAIKLCESCPSVISEKHLRCSQCQERQDEIKEIKQKRYLEKKRQ
ncbi:unnamed protein product [Bursaphelenchus xylophilus]|nr:unnamed protein product [Bursaphelenchus xylophilus]CAG9100018.1 unnamed protein product [Bursaphelenchus xylophilus]